MANLPMRATMMVGLTACTAPVLAAQSASIRTVARVVEPIGMARVVPPGPRIETMSVGRQEREVLQLTTRIGAPVRLTLTGGAPEAGLRLVEATGAIRTPGRSVLLSPRRAVHLLDVAEGRVTLVVSYL